MASNKNRTKNYNKNHTLLSLRAFIENEEGKVLIIKRSNTHEDGSPQNAPGQWSLPGGLLNYTEAPDDGLVRIVKQKTGLSIDNIDFIQYQNSPPTKDGNLHCLNMYFKASAHGLPTSINGSSDYQWILPSKLKEYNLAFKANEAIQYYEQTKKPLDPMLWNLVNEAARNKIPVSRDDLIKLQALPGFFTEMHADFREYEKVRIHINGLMQMIQKGNKRENDSIIRQIQSRTKEYSSVMEKMIRKGTDGIPRHYTTFDDNAGVRAVVQFVKDVYTVRNEMMKFNTIRLISEEDYIKNPKPSGYRSLHLTFEVPLEGLNFLPRCEVQIRTIAQQNISEGTHELVYKKKDIPEEYKKKVVSLWENAHNVDLELNDLRHNIEHLYDPK